MKKHLHRFVALILLVGAVTQLHAQGTAFTYQGRLTENGVPANGANDFTFTLYDSVNGGAPVGVSNVVNDLAVTNGLFTVALDFGAAFDGSARWVQIAVRPGASAGAHTNLIPRQPITSTPYAMRALNAGSANTAAGVTAGAVNNLALAADAVDGAKILNGSIASADLNASLLNGTFWNLGGNAGTIAGAHFLGTTDNQPLEFKVNGLRALRLENNGDSASDNGNTPDGAPNLIGGSPRNFVGAGVVGATIAGGGATNYGGFAYPNSVLANFGVVGGGRQNTIAANSQSATIAGGGGNDIGANSSGSVIGGGEGNTIAPNSWSTTIAGGTLNGIGTYSVYSTIGGGYDNTIVASGRFSTIAGGEANGIGTNSNYSAIGGGGVNNIEADSNYATIAGGQGNRIRTNSDYSAIGGGYDNGIAADASHATIAGGYFNRIGTNSDSSAIGGGFNNNIAVDSAYATIPGGDANSASNYAFAAGRRAKANHTGTFVWGDSFDGDVASSADNQFTVRASGGAQFFSNTGLSAGVSLAAGGTAWAVISDRNVKKDFAAVNPLSILEKLAALPITQWHYQWETLEVTPHIGPMAQDFKAAFYPGTDDKSITTQEADGVALAAIQGLNQKLEAGSQKSEDRIQKLETENAKLKQRLEKLERLMNHKLNGGEQ